MPFGPKCEYENFSACVEANLSRTGGNRDRARAYCATIMRATEARCRRRRMQAEAGIESVDGQRERDELVAKIQARYLREA